MKIGLDVSAVPAQPAGAGRYIVELAQRLPEHLTTELLTRKNDRERWEKSVSYTHLTLPTILRV